MVGCRLSTALFLDPPQRYYYQHPLPARGERLTPREGGSWTGGGLLIGLPSFLGGRASDQVRWDGMIVAILHDDWDERVSPP